MTKKELITFLEQLDDAEVSIFDIDTDKELGIVDYGFMGAKIALYTHIPEDTGDSPH